MRTCIGCRTKRTPSELVRVTCDTDGPEAVARIDLHGTGGRGAWLCRDVECVTTAGERRAFSRAFRRKLADQYFADTLLGWFAHQEQS